MTTEQYLTEHGYRYVPHVAKFFDQFGEKFAQGSGAGKPEHHHYGKGGLDRHTREVIELMFASNKTLNLNLNRIEIVLAGLYHDLGKIWDYDFDHEDNVIRKDHSKYVYHITRSGIEFEKICDQVVAEKSLPDVVFSREEVLHAILAHHGQKEWGSPVTPKTKLAWLIHLCDMISARMDDGHTKPQ